MTIFYDSNVIIIIACSVRKLNGVKINAKRRRKTLENMNKKKNKYEKEYLIDIKYFILLA